jgi:hypothetical protein
LMKNVVEKCDREKSIILWYQTGGYLATQ